MRQLHELPRISAPLGIFPSHACVGLLPGFLHDAPSWPDGRRVRGVSSQHYGVSSPALYGVRPPALYSVSRIEAGCGQLTGRNKPCRLHTTYTVGQARPDRHCYCGYVRVFVSHSSRDRWIARQLDRNLRNIPAVETFLDENDIQGGDRIAERVRTEMARCDEVVVLFSSASRQSDWVKGEIGAAWVLGKRIIILLDKLAPDDIPKIVSDCRAFDLNDTERYLEELEARTRSSA
jgi:TIR domain-containing protein